MAGMAGRAGAVLACCCEVFEVCREQAKGGCGGLGSAFWDNKKGRGVLWTCSKAAQEEWM